MISCYMSYSSVANKRFLLLLLFFWFDNQILNTKCQSKAIKEFKKNNGSFSTIGIFRCVEKHFFSICWITFFSWENLFWWYRKPFSLVAISFFKKWVTPFQKVRIFQITFLKKLFYFFEFFWAWTSAWLYFLPTLEFWNQQINQNKYQDAGP